MANKVKIRNILLLVTSLSLYSLWDYRFTFLLQSVIIINFITGILLQKDRKTRNLIFYITIILNLIPLLFFKYYNFFAGSINDIFIFAGLEFNLQLLKLILPVGISFYTFLSLSYIIDVYKRQIEPERNFIDYALSISYFPIIVSGPIHRPKIFLKQLKKRCNFDYDLAVSGLRQILTGLFYKIVIADSLAKHVSKVYGNYENYDGLTLAVGTVYFSFQLYFDFNGYSEMAIGISKLLGFKIDRNFKYPYLSRTIADFWKRWHISLTTWFRDYIFLPLSFKVSRIVKLKTVRSTDLLIYSIGIIVTWSLTGFWHGAGWTFILWGAVHAALLISNKWFFKRKRRLLKKLNIKRDNKLFIVYESLITFALVNLSWIFFRSETAAKGFRILGKILNITTWNKPDITLSPILLISFVLSIEFIQKDKSFLLDIPNIHVVFRWLIYFTAVISVMYYSGNESTFIYMGF